MDVRRKGRIYAINWKNISTELLTHVLEDMEKNLNLPETYFGDNNLSPIEESSITRSNVHDKPSKLKQEII